MQFRYLKHVVFVGLFLIPFVPFLVSSSFFFPFITTKAFAWRIIVELVFASWILLAVAYPEYRVKKSPLLYVAGFFLAAIGISNLFGVDPSNSFWSNFERMEGYLTLLHLGAFFLIISSVFDERLWRKWWNTSLAASALMIGYCLLQLAGVYEINQGGVRVDGTFGNAIYLAVYMLFHVFIATFFMLRAWKDKGLRWTYGILILFQLLILYFTATRGAILGLIGSLVVFAFLNIRNKEDRVVRKGSVAVLVTLLVIVGGFFLVRDTRFVTESPVLSRFSTLSLDELRSQGRYYVWPMAWEGFKERPILGWGQENFGYVFQEHYRSEMYNLEPWFDRAHNIFLDWMVAGGIVGLLSYLSLYVAALYLVWKRGGGFSATEKSLLTSLLAAYFFHSVFVFDHLVSYILFFSLLSYIHVRSAEAPLWQKSFSENTVKMIVVPATAIAAIFVIYAVNVKPIIANSALLEALRSQQVLQQPSRSMDYFEKAYNASTLGRIEVLEHAATQSVALLSSSAPIEEKNAFYSFLTDAYRKEAEKEQNNARFNLMVGSFFSSVGLSDEAKTHLERAVALVPRKQAAHFELGAYYINEGDDARALVIFKEAYEMAPEYKEAQLIYLIGAIYAGDRNIENNMLSLLDERTVAFDDRIVGAYYTNGRMSEVREILSARKELDPANAASYDELLDQLNGAQ